MTFFIFIPLLCLIFIRPFFSGLAYPLLEIYYQNIVIFLAIITLFLHKKETRKNAYILPIALLLLAYLLSTVFSINLQNSIRETIKFVSYLSIFFLVSQTDDRQKKILIKAIVIAASIIGLYSIYQYFWGYEHTLDYLKKINSELLLVSTYARGILLAKRAIGTFPSPTLLGGYLIMVFFLALQILFERGPLQRRESRTKLLDFARRIPVFPIIIILALILTKSMGAWSSLIATLIILFVLFYKNLKQPKPILIISYMIIVLAVTFILVTRWERLVDLENPQNSITLRLNYWRAAIGMIKDHPIVGVGPANFQEVFLKYKIDMNTDIGYGTRYAHNIFFHTWAEIGLLGLIGISWLIINFLRKLKTRPEHRFIFLAGLAFILHNFIDNSYFIPQTGVFWWVLLGFLF